MDARAFREIVDADDHLLAIGTVEPGRPLVHYAGAGWSRSGDFAGAEEWNEYLAQWSRRWNAPLTISVGD
jgi:hypothetical protein